MTSDTYHFKKVYLFLALFYFLGFAAFASTFFIDTEESLRANASGSIVNQLLGSLLLLLSVYSILHLKEFSLRLFVKHCFLWLVLILWFAATVLWSEVPMISLRRLIAFTSIVLACYCLVVLYSPLSLLRILAYGIVVAAVIGLIEAIVAPDSAFITSGIRVGAFEGMYFEKNAGARAYAYGLLVLVGLGLYRTNLGLLSIGILLLCILMAQSATATIICLSGCMIIFGLRFLASYDASKNLIRLVLLTIFSVIVLYLISLTYEQVLAFLGRDAGLTNRAVIWELLSPSITERFFTGYGFGAFWQSSSASDFLKRWGFVGNAHSGYFEALLHGGIVCLSLVFLIILRAISWQLKLYVYPQTAALAIVIMPIIILQAIVNYIGYVIINHNSIDMFFFLVCYFIMATQVSNLTLQKEVFIQ